MMMIAPSALAMERITVGNVSYLSAQRCNVTYTCEEHLHEENGEKDRAEVAVDSSPGKTLSIAAAKRG